MRKKPNLYVALTVENDERKTRVVMRTLDAVWDEDVAL